jgi:outer membrane PBP1 activator LpoA protein
MHIRVLTYLLILFSLLLGCSQPLLLSKPSATDKILAATNVAKQLEAQGKYENAAKKYLQLVAQTTPPAQQGYQLSAVKAYLKADKLSKAKAELDKLDVSKSFGLKIPLALAHTQIDLAERRVSQAVERLKAIDPKTLPEQPSLQIEYKQLHAQTLAAIGEVSRAVHEFQSVKKFAGSDTKILQENYQLLWRTLSSLRKSQLEAVPQKQGDIVSGWTALALLTKNVQQKHWYQSIKNWQLRFPKHPATQYIIPRLVQDLPTLMPPQQVALLLPLSNEAFGPRARAIQEGFFAAAETGEDQKNQPSIKVYDVNVHNILDEYQKAVNTGVDFIVGPLEKGVLEVLANSQPQLPVPTLALNHLETSVVTGNLYQFSLSPEDEARAVAIRAWKDGHRTAMVLAPEGKWGERVATAFVMAWEEQGGNVISQNSYGDHFKTSIKKILQRVKKADMVFMLSFSKSARQIRPLFLKYNMKNVPIYGTSHLYTGTPNPESDAKLNGVRFVDLPWVLAPNEDVVQWQRRLTNKKYKRLFALGVDAYTLLSRLQQLSQYEWQAQTGHLFVNNRGVIHRDKLRWAHFVDGKPQLLEQVNFFQ